MENDQLCLGMMGESHSPDYARSQPVGTKDAREQAQRNEDKFHMKTKFIYF